MSDGNTKNPILQPGIPDPFDFTPKQKRTGIEAAIAQRQANRLARLEGRSIETVRGTPAWIIQNMVALYEEVDAVHGGDKVAAHKEKATILGKLATMKGMDRVKASRYRKKMKANKSKRETVEQKVEPKPAVTSELAARLMANTPRTEQ